MDENPYQAPKGPSEPPWNWQNAIAGLLPLTGLLTGLAAGPICWFVLLVAMHEEHDPPLAQEFARAWPGAIAITCITGFFGTLLGFGLWTIWKLIVGHFCCAATMRE